MLILGIHLAVSASGSAPLTQELGVQGIDPLSRRPRMGQRSGPVDATMYRRVHVCDNTIVDEPLPQQTSDPSAVHPME